MAQLDTIKFQKISIAKFSIEDRNALIKELKRRNISHRATATAVLFDERFLSQVKDLVPPSSR
jgi:ribosomal protein L29